jgi:hypothetical protein
MRRSLSPLIPGVRRNSLFATLTFTVSVAVAAAGAGAGGAALAQAVQSDESPPMHDVYGTVLAVRGDTLRLQLRDGRTLAVDLREARALHHVVLLTTNRPVHVRGNPSAAGFHAVAVLKSHAGPEFWPRDR